MERTDVLRGRRTEIRTAGNAAALGCARFVQTAAVSIADPTQSQAVTADLDGDGDLDLLVNDGWVPNRGGTTVFEPWRELLAGHRGLQIAGDLDGDGALDVIAAGDNSHPLQWLPNTSGRGDFGSGQPIGREGTVASRLLLADLDQDGDLDLMTGQQDAARNTYAYWYRNEDGRGRFSMPISLASTPFTPLAIVDWNHDGAVDVIGNHGEELVVLHNHARHSFAATTTLADFPVTDLAVADIDHDGDDDLVTVENTYDDFSGDTSSRIWTHMNLGSERLPLTRVAEEKGRYASGTIACSQISS